MENTEKYDKLVARFRASKNLKKERVQVLVDYAKKEYIAHHGVTADYIEVI